MELLTYTVPEARFDYPDAQTTGITATYTLNNVLPATNLTPVLHDTDGYAVVKLPYQTAEGQVQVTWNFTIPGNGTYSRTQYYDVVTPLVDATEVRKIIGESATDDEVFAAEASARYIIQAYTGQSFGKYVGPISVTGSGEGTLRLPRRLISLNTINDNDILPSWVSLRGGGWYLVSKVIGPPTVRADFDGWHQEPWTGVITAPPRWARSLVGFASQVEFVIDGNWGWDSVPAAVQEAARLLINDYACGDSIYRDRYITAAQGPDWQLEFNDGAFNSTGNVRADALLADFKLRRGWQVL